MGEPLNLGGSPFTLISCRIAFDTFASAQVCRLIEAGGSHGIPLDDCDDRREPILVRKEPGSQLMSTEPKEPTTPAIQRVRYNVAHVRESRVIRREL